MFVCALHVQSPSCSAYILHIFVLFIIMLLCIRKQKEMVTDLIAQIRERKGSVT